jgi:GNAT superfamily N-acetyltransferase
LVSGVEVREAKTDAEIAGCFAVMAELRPKLVEADFVARVRVQMEQGFRLAFVADGGEVVAVVGFRVSEVLVSGRTLYVDDLVTAERMRSRGYGKTLLGWLEAEARALGCETFSLDSGTHRQEAHAFYFREGMRVTSFHFAKGLS